MTEKTKKPKLNIEKASLKSEMKHLVRSFMQSFLEPGDTVLKQVGGNYKVYDEILRDDQVQSTLSQRFTAVISAPWQVEPGGTSSIDKAAAEYATEQLNKIKFNKLTEKALYLRFYGFSVGELVWQIKEGKYAWEKIAIRDRSRFKFDVDCNLRLVKIDNIEGELCEEPYFWYPSVGATHDDDPYGLGLAHYLYWPVIFKRGGIKFWMKFIERFAQPAMLGKFKQGAPEEDVDTLLEAISLLASETGTVIPDDMAIDMVEASRNGTSDYSKLVEVMDKAISKIVVGQTMTTDDGSSKSQAQVHYDVRQDIIDADANLICESFTDGPLKWMTQLNFEGAATPILSRQTTPDEDLNTRVDRDVKIRSLGARPTQEYIDETYGEGWIVDNAPSLGSQQATSTPEFMAFAESFFPDQRQFDEAIDSITSGQMNDQMASVIEPIINFAVKHGPETALKKMMELYGEMDVEDLTDQLAQMLFVSDTWGRVNASR